jgi:hypothetical protein
LEGLGGDCCGRVVGDACIIVGGGMGIAGRAVKRDRAVWLSRCPARVQSRLGVEWRLVRPRWRQLRRVNAYSRLGRLFCEEKYTCRSLSRRADVLVIGAEAGLESMFGTF